MKTETKTTAFSAYFLAFVMFVETILPNYVLANKTHRINYQIYPIFGQKNIALSADKTDLDEVASINEIEKNERETIQLNIAGGPTQPEVQSFTPASADNMVDPFTGDFSYNIPLLDVDGYPINLAYSAGITMEQEATWVGLGWNINPGTINRHMRGIPDDFDGTEEMEEETNQKANKTYGVNVGVNFELFSFDLSNVNLGASLGVKYNNYTGYEGDLSFGPSFSIGKTESMGIGLQFSSSSQGGASIGGNLSLGVKDENTSKKLSIGSSLNSRQGFQQLSINLSQEKTIKSEKTFTNKNGEKENLKGGLGGMLGTTYNFGMSTYVPSFRNEMKTNSFTARFKLGPDLIGNDVTVSFTGFFHESKLKQNSKKIHAYGYMNLHKGQSNLFGQLDFNRENDGAFTVNTPALPIPILTYDIYSVSGNGIGGSYRLDRNDIGHVFDPKVQNRTNDFTVGGELGAGGTAKAGVDVGTSFTYSETGNWNDNNAAAQIFRYTSGKPKFREAGEISFDRSDEAFNKIGGYEPVRFTLRNERNLLPTLQYNDGSPVTTTPSNQKSLHFKSNQPLESFTIGDLKNNIGYGNLNSQSYAISNSDYDHHIGAFLVTKTDGMRYYYGLPAFSIEQTNKTFAVGKTTDNSPDLTIDLENNLIQYSNDDASLNNNKGLDNYYNSQKIPSYIHSYLLTSILSPNYVDIDGIPGPSAGDRGDYISFEYTAINNFFWKNPIQSQKASYIPGLNTDITDDKATITTGKKEIWYLNQIKTKNYVVVFELSDREDGKSLNSTYTAFDNNVAMKKIDKIKLYSRTEFDAVGSAATPIKTVHFKYDYSLCPNYPGYNGMGIHGNGKLTLKEVYFTYENSKKGEYNKYVFEYYNSQNGNAFIYRAQDVDRWGNYKKNPDGISEDIVSSQLKNSDFPYVGTDKNLADTYASAWNLKSIYTPSGSKIEIEYEADDYAFVQHLRATQMFLISGVVGQSGSKVSISDDEEQNRKIKFNLLPNTRIENYVQKGDVIYFKAALAMNKAATSFDYVPGYAKVDKVEYDETNHVGILTLEPAKLKDNSDPLYNPMAVAGIQFARNYLSRMIPPTEGSGALPTEPIAILKAMAAAFVNLREIFTGPNMPLWRDEIGCKMLVNKSWIRLNNPNYKKLGGGYRVKAIKTYDNWDQMVPNGVETYYITHYVYEHEGKSTGVATYEPQLGGDENPWRQYVANDIKLTLAPDIRNYMETPFGEQLFPTPSVGYSRVEIHTVFPGGVTKTRVGYTVNEYYTAKDFPTIARRTSTITKNYKSNTNLLLYTNTIDKLAVSQGFVVHNNDMHGKPKAVKTYASGQAAELSSVTYVYAKEEGSLNGQQIYLVKNDATLIQKDGTVFNGIIGRTYDAVADFRKSIAQMVGGNVGFNINYTVPFIIVPMILGANISSSETEFRSASFTKLIESKGILTQTIAVDNKSRIVTNNLAYDAETGEILLTSVNNSYGDTIYNFTYPAHWIYDGMGQAYKNLGYTHIGNVLFSNGYSSAFNNLTLSEGDEVIYKIGSTYHKGWITEVSSQGVKMEDLNANPISGTINYLRVIRSGRKNLQSTPIGTVTLSKNPLYTISSNLFSEVLSAQAIQYDYEWKKFCDCDVETGVTLNDFASGKKGVWNPTATFVHLSNRTQDFENQNTNIREDGIYESYTPMFKLENGIWKFDKKNWTTTAEVQEFSPNGEILETKDPLNRFSSNLIGYNQTHQVATSVNAQRSQIFASNFEDYGFDKCEDQHIIWKKNGNKINASDLDFNNGHTGRYALKVSAGSPIVYSEQILENCNPRQECDFSQNVVYKEGLSVPQIFIPYNSSVSMNYDIIEGNPIPYVTEGAEGVSLTFVSPDPFMVNVQLTDDNGCYTVIKIKNED